MSVFTESPYSVKDYPFILKTIVSNGYNSRLINIRLNEAKGIPAPSGKIYNSRGNIWQEYDLPDISVDLLKKRISDGDAVYKKLKSQGDSGLMFTVGEGFYLNYKGLKLNTMDYSKLPDKLKSRIEVFRVYKEGWVDFKFKVAGTPRKGTLYDVASGYIPNSDVAYILVRQEFDLATNSGLFIYYDDLQLLDNLNINTYGDNIIGIGWYPKQIGAFKDPSPALPGPNTSTQTGLAPLVPKADATVAAAKASLPSIPPIPAIPSVPTIPPLPSIASIPSTPTLPSVSIPSVSIPSVSIPSVSIPSVSGITSGTSGITGAISSATSGITGAVSKLATGNVTGAVGSAVSGVTGAVNSTIGGVTGAATSAASKVTGGISSWKPAHFSPSSLVKSSVNAVGGAVTSLAKGVTGAVSGAVSGATGTISNATSGVTGAVSGVASGNITGAVSSITKGVTGAVGSAVSGATGAATSAVKGATGVISSITTGAPKVDLSSASLPSVSIPSVSLSSLPSVSIPTVAIPSGMPTLPSSISSAAGKITKGVSDTVKGGVNRIKKIVLPKPPTMDEVNSKFTGAATNATSGVTGAVSGVTGAATSAVSDVTNAATGAIGGIGKTISGIKL